MQGTSQNSAPTPAKIQFKGTLFVITAPSGAGKTSLVRELLQRMPELRLSISHTTRPPRDGERDGLDYYFVSEQEFLAMSTEAAFLEHARVFGNYYGTSEKAVRNQLGAGHDVLLEIDWQGANQVRRLIPEAVSIFILPPSKASLEQRLRKRGKDSEESIQARLAEARDEMSHYAEADYLIINEQFDQAVDELRAVILAQRVRLIRQAERHAGTIGLLLG